MDEFYLGNDKLSSFLFCYISAMFHKKCESFYEEMKSMNRN